MTLIEKVATAMETCEHPYSSEHQARAAIAVVLRDFEHWKVARMRSGRYSSIDDYARENGIEL